MFTSEVKPYLVEKKKAESLVEKKKKSKRGAFASIFELAKTTKPLLPPSVKKGYESPKGGKKKVTSDMPQVNYSKKCLESISVSSMSDSISNMALFDSIKYGSIGLHLNYGSDLISDVALAQYQIWL